MADYHAVYVGICAGYHHYGRFETIGSTLSMVALEFEEGSIATNRSHRTMPEPFYQSQRVPE